ncbi:MAG: hypothetical protein IPJ34_02555 [Myxococcales bacterium]|nr:hypothetical protein [Myxococcales bacterium]
MGLWPDHAITRTRPRVTLSPSVSSQATSVPFAVASSTVLSDSSTACGNVPSEAVGVRRSKVVDSNPRTSAPTRTPPLGSMATCGGRVPGAFASVVTTVGAAPSCGKRSTMASPPLPAVRRPT